MQKRISRYLRAGRVVPTTTGTSRIRSSAPGSPVERRRAGRRACPHPPDTDVGVLALASSGDVIEITAADTVAIDATVDDDGRGQRLWITGVGDSDTSAPTLISWICRCGAIIAVSQHDRWPGEHRAHLDDH